MISVRIDSYQFQLRAAAVVIEENHLLLHRLKGDEFWALPGGRVNAGEQAEHTISREFIEELDLEVVCGEMLCVGENFFNYKGVKHHEVGLYFSVILPTDSKLRDKGKAHAGTEDGRHLEFKWFPLPIMHNIDFRPKVLQESLSSSVVPKHFVQHG